MFFNKYIVVIMLFNVIGVKSIFFFNFCIKGILSCFRWGKFIENNIIIWISDESDVLEIKEIRKDGNVVRLDK